MDWSRRWVPRAAVIVPAVVLGIAGAGVSPSGAAGGQPATTTTVQPPAAGGSGTGVQDPPGLVLAQSAVPTATQEARQLRSAGTRVVVNGKAIPLVPLAKEITGAERTTLTIDWLTKHGAAFDPPSGTSGSTTTVSRTRAIAIGKALVRNSPRTVVPRAIAGAVLQVMLIHTARQDGDAASMASARAMARQQEAMYQSAAASGSAPPLTDGVSVQQQYESKAAVKAYRNQLTFTEEMKRVAPEHAADGRCLDQRSELASWMAAHLATQGVRVTGVRGVTAEELPHHLAIGSDCRDGVGAHRRS